MGVLRGVIPSPIEASTFLTQGCHRWGFPVWTSSSELSSEQTKVLQEWQPYFWTIFQINSWWIWNIFAVRVGRKCWFWWRLCARRTCALWLLHWLKKIHLFLRKNEALRGRKGLFLQRKSEEFEPTWISSLFFFLNLADRLVCLQKIWNKSTTPLIIPRNLESLYPTTLSKDFSFVAAVSQGSQNWQIYPEAANQCAK